MLVFASAHRILELAHAFAEGAADLWDARGAEEKEDDDEEDEDFGKPDSEGHKCRLAAGFGALRWL